MTGYTVNKLGVSDVEILKSTWVAEAESREELPEATYERAVAWANSVINGGSLTQAEVHGVFCSNGDIHAIFDLVSVRATLPKGYYKILNMVVAPHLDLNGARQEDVFTMRSNLSNVVSEVIAHGLELLINSHEAVKIKFYASDRVTLSIMQRAWGDMEEGVLASTGFETNLYGNWAEFSKIE